MKKIKLILAVLLIGYGAMGQLVSHSPPPANDSVVWFPEILEQTIKWHPIRREDYVTKKLDTSLTINYKIPASVYNLSNGYCGTISGNIKFFHFVNIVWDGERGHLLYRFNAPYNDYMNDHNKKHNNYLIKIPVYKNKANRFVMSKFCKGCAGYCVNFEVIVPSYNDMVSGIQVLFKRV